MSYCKKCGVEITGAFCENCGAPAGSSEQPVSAGFFNFKMLVTARYSKQIYLGVTAAQVLSIILQLRYNYAFEFLLQLIIEALVLNVLVRGVLEIATALSGQKD